MGRKRIFDYEGILADYLAGASVKEIAAKHRCAGNMGTVLAKQRGVSRSPQVMKLVKSKRSAYIKESYAKSKFYTERERKHKRMGLYAIRHGIPAAAAKYRSNENRIRTIAKKYGWKRPPLLYDQDAILVDYLAGMSSPKIAEKHGCEQSYATKLAKRRGKARSPEFSNLNKRGPRGPHKKKKPQ